MSRRNWIFIVIVMLVLQACRKDPALDTDPIGRTLIELNIPHWAITPGHAPILPADEPLTVEGVALGRQLFYEKALSDDYSLSCGSCHLQDHAFSDPRQFSIGTDGSLGLRNSMPIINAVWDEIFFWDGRASSLEAQAFKPVVDQREMRNSWPVVVGRLQADPQYPDLFEKAFDTRIIDSVLVVKAIAQFERTLLSFNSRFDRYEYHGDSLILTPQEKRGKDLFFGEANCDNCHMAPLFHDHAMRNIGMGGATDEDGGLANVTGLSSDRGKFKTTTLRNIAVTAPYMHDGRFATLEEVVDFYADDVRLNDPNLDEHMLPWVMGEIDLDDQERADLVAFMLTLTDQGFLSDPAFSDPH